MSEASTVCPYCGAEWPAGLEMRFCGECGSKLGALSPEITGHERRTLTVLFADKLLSELGEFDRAREWVRQAQVRLADAPEAVAEEHETWVTRATGNTDR
jgi:hypothetical protein